jgi:hypothetical protein
MSNVINSSLVVMTQAFKSMKISCSCTCTTSLVTVASRELIISRADPTGSDLRLSKDGTTACARMFFVSFLLSSSRRFWRTCLGVFPAIDFPLDLNHSVIPLTPVSNVAGKVELFTLSCSHLICICASKVECDAMSARTLLA